MRRPVRGISVVQVLTYLVVLAVVVGGAVMVYRSMRPKVVVTTATRGPVVKAVYATGTISPVREFPIRAKREGTLESVLVDKGDGVKSGQSVGTIVEGGLRYAVDRAQADVVEKRARADENASPVLAEFDARIKAATEQLAIAQREEQRQRKVYETQAGSTTDVDRAADRAQAAWSMVESLKSQRATKLLELQREVAFAESALRTAQWNLSEQQLISPVDGVVLDRPKSQGTRVALNEVIMRVADVTPSKLVMRAAVDEEDITSVSVGQRVIMTLYAFEDASFVGHVKTIYAEADPNRRTFEVDVAVDKPSDRFQPGMTGELAFVVEEKAEATVLPAQSLKDGHVYIVKNGKIEQTTPRIGVKAVDRIEVIDGLDADAQVIISAIDESLVGRRPRVEVVDPRVAAGLNKPAATEPAFKGFSR